MKVRQIKTRFHGRFYVNYKEREIFVGPNVMRGRFLMGKRFRPSWGTVLYQGCAPVLPRPFPHGGVARTPEQFDDIIASVLATCLETHT